jgi:hypothetical protein
MRSLVFDIAANNFARYQRCYHPKTTFASLTTLYTELLKTLCPEGRPRAEQMTSLTNGRAEL